MTYLPVYLTSLLRMRVTAGVVAPCAAITKPTMCNPKGQLTYDCKRHTNIHIGNF